MVMERRRQDGFEAFVIYDHPRDFPHAFVVRRWELTPAEIPTNDVVLAADLAAARAQIPRGCVCFDRMPMDEPQIVEVWL